MLRSGSIARRTLQRQATVPGITLLSRSATQWRHGGKSASSNRKGAGTRAIRKGPNQLEINEKQTLREIEKLQSKLDTQKKSEEARKAHENLGEYDDKTLEQVYAAINVPDPPLEEDLRLEVRRRRKRSIRLLIDRRGSKSYLDTWHGARLAQRLITLKKRLELLDHNKVDEPQSSTSAYERETQLWKSLMAPEFNLKEDDLSIGHGGAGESDQTLDVSQGRAVFEDKEAREALLKQVEDLTTLLTERASMSHSKGTSALPLGIVTSQEWGALSASFAFNGELDGVKRTVTAAKQNRQMLSMTRAANTALDVYATKGAWEVCQHMLAWMSEQGVAATSYTNHCIVKSFIRANRFDEVFDLLRGWEDQQPASLETYTYVLSSLIQQNGRPALQSRVWTLFQRMRLVAHPIPDAPCYAQMMRACAIGIPQSNDALWKPPSSLLPKNDRNLHERKPGKLVADAERALDLLREMTDRYNIRPTPEVYSALIMACGHRKDMYQKALQLFGNMVAMERERMESIQLSQEASQDLPSYAPTRETFNALLSGCARSADVMRARWILAEMLRSAAKRWEEIMSIKGEGGSLEPWEVEEFEERLPNAETIAKVLYTYASYEPSPPTLNREKKVALGERERTKVSQGNEVMEQQTKTQLISEEIESLDRESVLTLQIPQSKAAVLREAMALMERIKIDHKEKGGLLSVVSPDAAMINSFMAVLSKHSKKDQLLQQIQEIFYGSSSSLFSGNDLALNMNEENKSLFEYFGIEPNGHTYEAALEACSRMDKSEEALQMALDIWRDWEVFSKEKMPTSATEAQKLGLTSITISRAWSALIHVLAKNDRLDDAMDRVRQFATFYPPQLAASASTTSGAVTSAAIRRPDRFALQHQQGAARNDHVEEESSSSASSTTTRPSLTFKQIEVLHMRLVEREDRGDDIKFVTWLLRSYRNSSQPKKPESLRGVTLMNRQGAIRELLERRNNNNSSYISVTPTGIYRG